MKGTLLAIDPATVTIGYSLLSFEDKKASQILVADRLRAKGDLTERLLAIREEVTKLIEEHKPTHVAVEDLKFSKFAPNLGALVKVAYAIGNILTVYESFDYPQIGMFTANSVRKQWGVAQNKPALRKAVNDKYFKSLIDAGYPNGLKKAHEDISDSLGLGLTCISEIKRDKIDGKIWDS